MATHTINEGTAASHGQIATLAEVLADMGLTAPTAAETTLVTATISRAESAVRRYLGYDPTYRTHTEYYPRTDYSPGSAETVWESEGDEAILRGVAGAGANELQLQHIPIRGITSLYIDYDGRAGARVGAFAASSLKVEGTDYWPNYDGVDDSGNRLCRDGLVRSVGRWPTVAGCVKIIYISGYTSSELHGESLTVDATPILETVIMEAARRARLVFMTQKHTGAGWLSGPLASENLGDYSYSVDTASAALLTGVGRDLTPDSKERLSEFRNMGWSFA